MVKKSYEIKRKLYDSKLRFNSMNNETLHLVNTEPVLKYFLIGFCNALV